MFSLGAAHSPAMAAYWMCSICRVADHHHIPTDSLSHCKRMPAYFLPFHGFAISCLIRVLSLLLLQGLYPCRLDYETKRFSHSISLSRWCLPGSPSLRCSSIPPISSRSLPALTQWCDDLWGLGLLHEHFDRYLNKYIQVIQRLRKSLQACAENLFSIFWSTG